MHGGLLYLVQHIPGLLVSAQPNLRGGESISLALRQNEPRSILLELRGGGGGSETDSNRNSNKDKSTNLLFEDIFESHPCIDYSDNHEQAKRIKHHYMNEFGYVSCLLWL